jgi:hypothetical protein
VSLGKAYQNKYNASLYHGLNIQVNAKIKETLELMRIQSILKAGAN